MYIEVLLPFLLVYSLVGLVLSRLWWNINRTESAYLSTSDGPQAVMVFMFWPLWVLWRVSVWYVRLILDFADELTKLVKKDRKNTWL